MGPPFPCNSATAYLDLFQPGYINFFALFLKTCACPRNDDRNPFPSIGYSFTQPSWKKVLWFPAEERKGRRKREERERPSYLNRVKKEREEEREKRGKGQVTKAKLLKQSEKQLWGRVYMWSLREMTARSYGKVASMVLGKLCGLKFYKFLRLPCCGTPIIVL